MPVMFNQFSEPLKIKKENKWVPHFLNINSIPVRVVEDFFFIFQRTVEDRKAA
jgi:hypothetical protein